MLEIFKKIFPYLAMLTISSISLTFSTRSDFSQNGRDSLALHSIGRQWASSKPQVPEVDLQDQILQINGLMIHGTADQ